MKSATVANGLASVKVAINLGPVVIPSMPVTEMLPDELSGASATTAVVVNGLGVVVAPPVVVTVIDT